MNEPKPVYEKIEGTLMQHLHTTHRPMVIVIYSLYPDFKEIRTSTNVTRAKLLDLLQGTIDKMLNERN